MRKIRYWLIQVFGISKTEANGVTALLFILLVAIVAPSTVQYFIASNEYTSMNKDQAILDSLLASMVIKEKSVNSDNQHANDKSKFNYSKFVFNPNVIEQQDLLKLGFTSSQANNLINYRSSGGDFKIKSDLLKLYKIDSTLYLSLYDYISLPDKVDPYTNNTTYTKSDKDKSNANEVKPLRISLNTTDSIELQQVKGIGPVLSARIIKYRDKLGGFINVGQLDEVYGLKEETLIMLKETIYQDSLFAIEPININSANYFELSRHPYIDSKIANTILAYRKQHGNFSRLEELNRIHLISEEFYHKIKPYLVL